MSALLSSLDILSVICGFLSTPQEILCCLSHLNRPIAQQVRPVCFSSQALLIPNHRVLLALLDRRRRRVVPTAFADTLACLGAVHSLAIRCEPRSADESKACEGALVKWCDLTSQSANSTSSFLFASLSSLSIRCLPHPPLRLTRRSLFRLLSSQPASFASLTSLDVELNDSSSDKADVSLHSLRSLQHVRLAGSFCHVSALGSVLRAVSSLPCLITVDLATLTVDGDGPPAAMLTAFVNNPPPLPSPIRHLLLPSFDVTKDNIAQLRPQADRLARALTIGGSAISSSASATSTSSTQAVDGLHMLTSNLPFAVAGLTALMSVPSIRVLDLSRARIETSHVCQALEALADGFLDSQPHLVALLFPIMEFDEDMQELMDRFALALPNFLSGQTGLRHLSTRLMSSSAGGGYFQDCCQSLQQLQSLELIGGLFTAVLELHSPLSLPHLLDVTLESIEVQDEYLGVLLSVSPQLLRLRLNYCELESWCAVRMAALHCPSLLHLEVSGFVDESTVRGNSARSLSAASRPPTVLDEPRSFLPCLVLLSLCQRPQDGLLGGTFLFSDLHPLLQSTNRCLQSVRLVGSSLTAADVYSLSVLPSLSFISLSHDEARVTIPEVQSALHTMRVTSQGWESSMRQSNTIRSPYQPWRYGERIAALDVWDGEAFAQRLRERSEEISSSNLLHVEGRDVSAVRPLFFELLQAEMAHSPFAAMRRGRPRLLDLDQPWRSSDEEDGEEDEDVDDDVYEFEL